MVRPSSRAVTAVSPGIEVDGERDRSRSLDGLARGRSQPVQGGKRFPHDAGAALRERDQALTQTSDMLLDSEATNFAVTIPEPGARPVAPKELRLDHQRGVAGPPA